MADYSLDVTFVTNSVYLIIIPRKSITPLCNMILSMNYTASVKTPNGIINVTSGTAGGT